MPKFVACGSRSEAYHVFCAATQYRRSGDEKLLLVDSEFPILWGTPVWVHVRICAGNGWGKPNNVEDSELHFMVQCMEAWFFADVDALQSYYGNGFKTASLSTRPIEQMPPQDIVDQLKTATKSTTKGEYNKGKHSFDILRRIDLHKLESASPFAKRFFDHLRTVCQK